MRPAVLQYIQDGPTNTNEDEIMVKAPKQASDHSDLSDLDLDPHEKKSEKDDEKDREKIFVQGSEEGSDRSYRSDSKAGPYNHLIVEEYL
jgi:hypothetical protein